MRQNMADAGEFFYEGKSLCLVTRLPIVHTCRVRMEIFATFDDSVFLEARDKVSVTLCSYNAKLCEPEWFCENTALNTDDPLEKQKVYKFRGDFAVRQGDHQKGWERGLGGCIVRQRTTSARGG